MERAGVVRLGKQGGKARAGLQFPVGRVHRLLGEGNSRSAAPRAPGSVAEGSSGWLGGHMGPDGAMRGAGKGAQPGGAGVWPHLRE